MINRGKLRKLREKPAQASPFSHHPRLKPRLCEAGKIKCLLQRCNSHQLNKQWCKETPHITEEVKLCQNQDTSENWPTLRGCEYVE
jgi:hypothetical protein